MVLDKSKRTQRIHSHRPNGNSIFLPSIVYGSQQEPEEGGGSIWSSTPYKDGSR